MMRCIPAGVLLSATAIALAAFGSTPANADLSHRATSPTRATASSIPASSTAQESTPSSRLEESFSALRKRLSARSLAIAFSPIDSDGPCTVYGDFSTGNAWSTVKVPIAIAALHKNDSKRIRALIVSAITVSDNDAAGSLFNSLGARPQATTMVEKVLRRYGDSNTQVQRVDVEAEESWRHLTDNREAAVRGFGLSQWGLKDQCRFAKGLLRDVDAEEFVTEQMANITPSQKWGLGIMSSSRFKGGWGPDSQGRYLVRQFGVIPLKGTRYAVAIATNPTSGTFSDGTKQLNAIVTWAAKNL